jgi:hypothetical protein
MGANSSKGVLAGESPDRGHQAIRATRFRPLLILAVFSQLDITGYNYNILPTYQKDHEQLPSRMMLTTES